MYTLLFSTNCFFSQNQFGFLPLNLLYRNPPHSGRLGVGASMLEQENCMQYIRHVNKVDMHIFFRNRFLTTAVVWNKQILHTRTYTNTLIV